MDEIIVGIDVGTTKICTLVAKVEQDDSFRILGVGIELSKGIRKGIVVDLSAASQAIARSVAQAEQTSGVKIESAIVGLSGAHVASINSRGVVAISGRVIEESDVERALDAAQAVAIPSSQEIINVIHRGFSLDSQDGILEPIGMHGLRLEVETHLITVAAVTAENLRQAVGAAGVQVGLLVLSSLASAKVVLTEPERNLGAVVCDIGGGTTDLAIYVNGDVWHSKVLAIGGNNITQDISYAFHLSFADAEDAKRRFGNALEREINHDEFFELIPFGADRSIKINRRELAYVIQARVEEIFELILKEIKRSGYDGLLASGMVLTGGCGLLSGIQKLGSEILGMPVRVGHPKNIIGMIDRLNSPAFSASVGLLRWTYASDRKSHNSKLGQLNRGTEYQGFDKIKDIIERLVGDSSTDAPPPDRKSKPRK